MFAHVPVGPKGEDYGFLEYWVRLRFPIEQILRLHRQRTKALGYLSAGVPPRTPVAQEVREGELRSSENLFVHVVQCSSDRVLAK